MVDGRAAAAHLRAAHAELSDPVARARTAVVLDAGPHVHHGARAGARDRQARRSPSCGPEQRDVRRRLRGPAGGRGAVGRRAARRARRRWSRTAPASTSRARARACWRRWPRSTWSSRPPPCEDCVALVERASADGSLLEEDEGLFTVVVLHGPRHGRPRGGDRLSPTRWSRRAHRRGSQFGVLAVSLWRGWLHLRRGDLLDAADSLRTALGELDAWHGAAGGDVYAAAHYAQALFERGRPRRRLARASTPSCATSCGRRSRARAGGTAVECELLLASGRAEEALALSERMRVDNPHVENPTAITWRSPQAPCAAPARAHRRGARAREREPRDRAPLRRAVRGRPRAARARRAARRRRACPRSREAVAVVEGTPARLRAGQGARRARPRAAPRAPARRRPRAAAPRARAGRRLRRRRARRGRAHGALRRRRAAAHRRAERRRRAHRERAPRRRARRRGREQPRHRPDAVRDPEDGRGPPLQRRTASSASARAASSPARSLNLVRRADHDSTAPITTVTRPERAQDPRDGRRVGGPQAAGRWTPGCG